MGTLGYLTAGKDYSVTTVSPQARLRNYKCVLELDVSKSHGSIVRKHSNNSC